MAFASDTRTIALPLGNRFSAWVAQVQAARAKRKVYNITFNELSALSNAELADIGLNRSMIKSVARSAADNI